MDLRPKIAIPYPQTVKDYGDKVTYLDVESYCLYLIRYKDQLNWKHPQLYKVWGMAPTYTFPKDGTKYYNLKMNWWILRNHPFVANYTEILGQSDYTVEQVMYVNRFFLKHEAEAWKEWLDKIYPEENTQMEIINYPMEYKPFEINAFTSEIGYGSNVCFEGRWFYDFQICYYIDTR